MVSCVQDCKARRLFRARIYCTPLLLRMRRTRTTRRGIEACLQGRKNLERRYSHDVLDDTESDFTSLDKASPIRMTFPQDLFALVGGSEHPVAFRKQRFARCIVIPCRNEEGRDIGSEGSKVLYLR